MNDVTSPFQLSALRISGADAKPFLQGQLTCDMQKLTTTEALLGSCNSPQGRTQAVFMLMERTDGIVMILPASMIELIAARLRKYVLRSKVHLHDERERLHVKLLSKAHLAAIGLNPIDKLQGHLEIDRHSLLRWPDPSTERYLLLADNASDTTEVLSINDWQLADIRAGIPHVVPSTHEAFTAQMLNIDLLGAISFEKGCYTGQEIIARTHYRGTLKRRMHRFAADCAPLAPGTRLVTNGEHAGDVVYAAMSQEGCELLAVLNVASVNSAIHPAESGTTTLRLMPLPYSLSD